jgi:hypothetical protein
MLDTATIKSRRRSPFCRSPFVIQEESLSSVCRVSSRRRSPFCHSGGIAIVCVSRSRRIVVPLLSFRRNRVS